VDQQRFLLKPVSMGVNGLCNTFQYVAITMPVTHQWRSEPGDGVNPYHNRHHESC
jgi:hypothetical protein